MIIFGIWFGTFDIWDGVFGICCFLFGIRYLYLETVQLKLSGMRMVVLNQFQWQMLRRMVIRQNETTE